MIKMILAAMYLSLSGIGLGSLALALSASWGLPIAPLAAGLVAVWALGLWLWLPEFESQEPTDAVD